MELRVDRAWKRERYTISRLFVDGQRFSDTVEDRDRGLSQTDALAHIRAVKVPQQTAIPCGRYRVTMGIVSPRFSQLQSYAWCGGRLPRLLNVPGFEGILIHAGSNARSTAGCIIVGRNTVKGGVTESMPTLKRLWEVLDAADRRGESIYITIG